MDKIEKILKAKLKPKEKTLALTQQIKSDKNLLKELVDFYEKAKDPEKGTCLSAITQISEEDPKVIVDYLDFVINQINYKAPRVKWEASETVANVSKTFPDKIVKAIPKLLENTRDEGTVVRWSAAYGLTEITRNNPKTRKDLIPLFETMIKKEANSGVKNVYIKTLKVLQKS